MFKLDDFPFNVMQQMNPWLAAQAKQGDDSIPPAMKPYMEAYSAWFDFMTRSNPWMASYMQMMENATKAATKKKD